MGIDPGLSVTGVGVIEYIQDQSGLIGFHPIRTKANLILPERLKIIYDAVTEQIRETQAEVCVVEDVFGGKNLRSALLIGQARASAILAAVNAGLTVAEFTPAEVKISLVGNGSASKEQVQYMVKNLLKLQEKPFPLDCSDALAIALCYANRLKFAHMIKKG
jgi:crossover junction endodeoxyribonuclease RuvC